ncbi:hypothetical protein D3C76_1487950 [compost metagenome]
MAHPPKLKCPVNSTLKRPSIRAWSAALELFMALNNTSLPGWRPAASNACMAPRAISSLADQTSAVCG